MHLILLSGGSGKRLWPLSNDVMSKQFLRLLRDENGNTESMIQRVYRQIKEIDGYDSVTVAAAGSQREYILSQIGDEVNIVSEPERRDTFPAIALACSYLLSEKGIGQDECIAVLPVDPYVDSEFFEKIKGMENEVKTMGKDGIVLLGVEPTTPSEKFGYILPKGREADINDVAYFKEKPTEAEATVLIEQGALWNCGVFGMRLGYVVGILREKYDMQDLSYENMKRQFRGLKKTSFDYEVVEQANKMRVIKYCGAWKDLGTWETLTEEMRNEIVGKVSLHGDCKDSHIVNTLDIPVVAMSVENVIIAASRDGILVADKGETHKLKEVLKGVEERPMYEERRWGKYEVLDYSHDGATEILVKKLIFKQGGKISYQIHNHRKEIWTVVAGSGEVYLEGNRFIAQKGDVITIESGMKHAIKALGELEIIEVQLGNKLTEEDILRIDLDW